MGTSSRRRRDFTMNKRNSVSAATAMMPRLTRARVGLVVEAVAVVGAGPAAAAVAAGIARITQGLMTVAMAVTRTVLMMNAVWALDRTRQGALGARIPLILGCSIRYAGLFF